MCIRLEIDSISTDSAKDKLRVTGIGSSGHLKIAVIAGTSGAICGAGQAQDTGSDVEYQGIASTPKRAKAARTAIPDCTTPAQSGSPGSGDPGDEASG